MGFDLDEPGWQKNKGLRIVGAGHRLELPWPELASFPPYGMVRTREELDEILSIADRVDVMYEGRIVGSFPAETADIERIGLLMTGGDEPGEDGRA